MPMSMHLTNSRGLWFWSIIADGKAFEASSQGFTSASEAQQDARATMARYRALLGSMTHLGCFLGLSNQKVFNFGLAPFVR